MDFKDLNKSQLVLLTLLVSFIASIATSIATVSLLQAAPTNVTNTINRVIEKTIEQATPSGSSSKTVQTVVVKEDDLIVDAIARYQSAQVKIAEGTDPTAQNSVVVATGFIAGPNNLVIADGRHLDASKSYIGSFGKDSHAVLKLLSNTSGIAILSFPPPSTADPALKLPDGITVADPKNIKIGQTLVFYSDTASKVLKLIASSFTGAISSTDASGASQTSAYGTINLNNDIPADFIGLPALTLDGEAAGLAIQSADSSVKLIDPNAVNDLLKSAVTPKT